MTKTHLLCAYHLRFDWSGWIVLIKRETVLIVTVWSGQSVLTNGNCPKFFKAIVLAVLHHFRAPVTLQSQNYMYINFNNPIKMMANFQMNFPTSEPKTLICWKKMKIIERAECNIPPNNNLICWLFLADHQNLDSNHFTEWIEQLRIHFCLSYKFSWSVWLWSLFKGHSFTWMVDSTLKKMTWDTWNKKCTNIYFL